MGASFHIKARPATVTRRGFQREKTVIEETILAMAGVPLGAEGRLPAVLRRLRTVADVNDGRVNSFLMLSLGPGSRCLVPGPRILVTCVPY